MERGRRSPRRRSARYSSITRGAAVSDLAIESSSQPLLVFSGIVERVVSKSTSSSLRACALGSFTPDGAIVRDSVCWHTGVSGIGAGGSIGGAAAISGTLRNVTAIASGANGRGVVAESLAGGQMTIDAVNVIADGGSDDIEAMTDSSMDAAATVSLDRSNFAGGTEVGTGATIVTGAGNQSDPPLFADVAVGDFHQLPGSPTIDAGTADPLLGDFDLDGEARIQGAAIDIGADEAVPPPDTTPPDTQIDSGPTATTTSTSASFTYLGIPAADTDHFECKLDAGPFQACPAAGKDYSGLTVGPHTFAVRAVDASDNEDPTPATRTWTIAPPPDGTPPDTSIALTLDAKRRQKVRRLKVTLGCGDEACEARLRGKVVARRKRGAKGKRSAAPGSEPAAEVAKKGRGGKKRRRIFRVRPRTISLAAGETKTKRVKLKRNRRSVRKLRRLLRRKPWRQGTRARLRVRAADAASNTATERVRVRLRR